MGEKMVRMQNDQLKLGLTKILGTFIESDNENQLA